MKKFIIIAILAAIAYQAYSKYQSHHLASTDAELAYEDNEDNLPQKVRTENSSSSAFKCDGRIYCSQMTSCGEAKLFLKNCSGVKMDGNNDGIPCEKQWCK